MDRHTDRQKDRQTDRQTDVRTSALLSDMHSINLSRMSTSSILEASLSIGVYARICGIVPAPIKTLMIN
jgi:hypothetical protein